ncbi:MAG: hypothetical protein MI747_24440 [Desulfobacterales bacterium]|nr:hypothetical protein [Desulfobacterales bacterium]
MKATISTRIRVNGDEMWGELQKISSLVHVARPLLSFKTRGDESMPGKWTIGEEYGFRLFLFGWIPLGEHFIQLEEVSRTEGRIVSRERGDMTPVWNHTILLEDGEGESLAYTDEIEIKAGILTPFIWAFAHVFYRHRQRRWKLLLEG